MFFGWCTARRSSTYPRELLSKQQQEQALDLADSRVHGGCARVILAVVLNVE
jgi:hypothetical protein